MRLKPGVIAGVVGVSSLAAITIAAARPDAQQTRLAERRASGERWAELHKAALPTTLDAYATLPGWYRRAAYRRLSVSQQGVLWREHLETFVLAADRRSPIQQRIFAGIDAPLSNRQLRIVNQAIASVGWAYDSMLTLTQRKAIAKTVCDSAHLAFDAIKLRLIFGMIPPFVGVPDTTRVRRATQASLIAPVVELMRAALRRVRLVPPAADCGCATDGCSECGRDLICAIPNCQQQPSGCGCMGLSVCAYNCTQ
jgi:hypothetical protein